MRPTCFIVYRLLAATLAVLALTAPRALAEPSTTIRNNGSPSNRVDVTILGDGYTAAEMGKYASDVEAFVTGFFAQQPFDEYQFLFNVHRVDVVSAQSGADHPERSPAVFKNTALDATYNCAAIQRLICVDMTKVNNVLSASVAAEKRDVVLIIVNDPEYGGSGGAVAVASTHTAAVEVVLHELGHTLGLLADEYAGGGPSCNASVEPSEANATRATTRPTIKWNAWIDATTPIPTFGPTVGLPGLYEEAKYCFTGLYRPTYDSKMRSLDRPFEQINNEQLVKRFYNWAAPIDAITPSGSVSLGTAHSQTFTVTTQTPRTHALDVRWRVDGGAVAGTGPSFVLNGSTLAPGNHTVTVEVSDPTAFVRVDPAGALDDNRVWTVNVFTEGGGGSGANLQVLVDGKSVTELGRTRSRT